MTTALQYLNLKMEHVRASLDVYLVICIKLSNEAFPVSKIVVYPVISSNVDVGQNPQITTSHLYVYHCQKKNSWLI